MMHESPSLYYVERAIPEIGAVPGDILADDPSDGVSILRRVAAVGSVIAAYRASLRALPRPSREPIQPPLFITTPPVDGWQ
jgi:hypothetical protein